MGLAIQPPSPEFKCHTSGPHARLLVLRPISLLWGLIPGVCRILRGVQREGTEVAG